ncbi:uncharacterized protein KQ657_004566 [Scheffersomyces spartinae]|uniref:Vacuolar protein 14 C-terminal Fig4-binding domain-containing protein n=1 Tax=Scheffersomyces spartinae TaxID=45513 RepID=A0A9P8AJ14_9ASCO|nr:uncharacterized protein KQ657_004566 [Scheffersomyces spartinae]KAG7194354.1 hypothetical protein KQ657_004566 [Scheffersomyces spartinae]
MSGDNHILDASIIKDLSNHIYEKRKATAFQIESLTKHALSDNDSQTIYKIIGELTELTVSGSNTGKMGAITALGSVSVALGSFAIAYFLEEIVKPIFVTFRDTDARVRYYACESLYNISKIARGEILLYFNEVFDVLCILVTDTESSVKNAADILDRLVKDVVSAKSTNYVSILHHQETPNEIQSHLVDANGDAIQINNIQDPQKAFSLPKFIPTLLERIHTIDPFAKKFLISWLELFDAIPSLELITFLPNFLKPLITFLMNNAPSDVRLETENLMNIFLKEIISISKVKIEAKRKQLLKDKHRQLKEQQRKTDQESTKHNEGSLEKDVKNLNLESSGEGNEVDDKTSIKSTDTTIMRPQKQNNAVDDNNSATDSFEDDEDEGLYLSGQDIFIDFPSIISILFEFLRPNSLEATEMSRESHDIYLEIQFIVLKWLQEILLISPTSFIKCFPDCISIVIKNLAISDSRKDYELRAQLLGFNNSLQSFLVSVTRIIEFNSEDEDTEVDSEYTKNILLGLNRDVYDEFLEFQLGKTKNTIIQECLTSNNELARITSLDWLTLLYSKYKQHFFDVNSQLDLTVLLRFTSTASNEVVLKLLHFLSKMSESNESFFKEFIKKLVAYFKTELMDKTMTSNNRGEFVIRKLCFVLSSEKIYKAFSEALTNEEDMNFLKVMIDTLNRILLTTHELAHFRKKLKNLDPAKPDDLSLFSTLFQSWSHSASSALSLCLLTSNYELAFLIIQNLSETEVDFELLTQLDILIQLLESPIFLKLRLQLLEPEKNPYLYKSLFGILMILPQSSTYNTLKNRLSALKSMPTLPSTIVPTVSSPTPSVSGSTVNSSNAAFSLKRKRLIEMIDIFAKVQDKHHQFTIESSMKQPQYKESIQDQRSELYPSYGASISEFNDASSKTTANRRV